MRQTVVSVSPFAISHNTRNFYRTIDFIPERWLLPEDLHQVVSGLTVVEANEIRNTFSRCLAVDQRAAWQPFSTGPRNCAGMALAWAEIRYALAAMVLSFDLQIPHEAKDFSWSAQKTYSTWERKPLMMSCGQRKELPTF